MKKHILFPLSIISLILCSCASQMKIKGTPSGALQPLSKTETVVIIEENESIVPHEKDQKIGDFEIKDGGLSLDCSYERVKNLAKQKARSVGGNSVKITEHTLPSTWSNCHRIKFEVHKLEHTAEFEKEMIWSSTNKLKWDYFKDAPKIDRSSFFCGYIDVQFNDVNFLNGKGEVTIFPTFIFECSYVQPLKMTKYLLEYNQVKFDLLEIYARKMRSEFVKSEINTQEKWTKFAKAIYDKVYREYETDIFNLETETSFGENESELVGWKFKTVTGLKELTEFSSENI
ncbi:hypothetical protein [Gelidibacter salicanalis]|uniref:Lipoprotein n=1 Tax=Gelidibacter salicanalis TaxID=291193 RepID=A0A934NJS6_9FLAO|nr:hypothetical protein [Gelidibacter salicanalis]MBJ7881849.1 hypothetical protein [Gelidibacter salicanalis]